MIAPMPMRASQLVPRRKDSIEVRSSALSPQDSAIPNGKVKDEQDAEDDSFFVSGPVHDKSKIAPKSERSSERRVTSASKASSGLRTPKAKANSSKENASSGGTSSFSSKKHPSDYSIYKGRGRYATTPQ